jgi:Domain of unknown function (DUF4338)
MNIEDQWKIWQEKNPPSSFTHIDEDVLRERLIKELTYVSAMTVEEYTLYQKWLEIHEKYPTHQVDTLFGEETQLIDPDKGRVVEKVKANIWRPESPDSYLDLQPELISTDDRSTVEDFDLEGNPVFHETKRTAELSEVWATLRVFGSTMKNNSNIGRNMHYIVQDKVSGKYLGVICITGDFLDLTPRDKYIGWTRHSKTMEGMINHTCIGSTIVPLQPLGFSYVGGKLLALLCLSDTVQNEWLESYGNVLVGVTTTSLYGSFSQYQNLQHWKKRGHTAGSVTYEPTKEATYMVRDWIKENYPRKYFEWYDALNAKGQPYKRDHKNRSRSFAYAKLGIPKNLIRSDHSRGIYFSTLYDNSREFLRKEITADKLVKSFDTSTETLVQLWKDRYASKRVSALIEQDRLSNAELFYDDMIFLSWEETKEKYLKQVGR